MANREPLLDTEWLLGLPDPPEPWWQRFLTQLVSVLVIVTVGVALWPWLSKAWLQNQLTSQVQNGLSADSRKAAMIALAELLPDSLPVVIAGLAKPSQEEAHLAFEALDYYIGQVTTLPVEKRRGFFAELIHSLEEIANCLPHDSGLLATALAARVSAAQQSDQHPGALVTQAACQRIIEGQLSPADAPMVAVAPPPSADLGDSMTPPIAATAPVLSNPPKDDHQESQLESGAAIATVDNTTPSSRVSIKSIEEASLEPPAFENSMSAHSPSDSGHLKQKLLIANRLVPATMATNLTVPSNSVSMLESRASSLANDSSADSIRLPATTSRSVNPEEEVIGIGRQKTEYLLSLLGSVTPRLASAAFQELRTRLSPKELEIAVELAQGTTEQRMLAMERLTKESDIDPIEWLAWMGNEADREVRFKAVSLLGSINNDDARLKLRLMHNRERDAEISRHIQSALLAGGSLPHIR